MASSQRRDNLELILKDRFKGKIATLARAIGRDDAYVWQLLNSQRNIGERMARHIEAKLELGNGALDAAGMAVTETLSLHEREMLERYRKASASWQIALRYLANLKGDVQDEISQSVNVLLAKVSAEHAPDERVARAYGKPPTLHEPATPRYKKKTP